MIDDLPYRPGDTPPTGAAPDGAVRRSRPDGAELVRGLRELREEAADRVPVPLRARPGLPPVPWRAAAVALVLALAVATVMITRARAGAAEEIVPIRSDRSATRSATRSAARSASDAPGSAVGSPTASRVVNLVPAPDVDGGAGAGAAAGRGTGAARVVVHVSGRVRRPGLVRLPSGSRVWDAVAAAGGPGPGARLDRLNLARPLVDGEKITVPDADDPLTAAPEPVDAMGGAGGGPHAAASGTVIDLNAATPADLDTLPGVGPVLAGRIVAWRTQHGRFSRVEELGEVTGIGDKLLAQLTPLVRV